MRRQKLTGAEQKLMVLEILKGTKSVGQVAKEHGVSDALLYKWRDKALKAISSAFNDNSRKNREDFNIERDRLLKIIGDQVCVIDTLKKTSDMLSL